MGTLDVTVTRKHTTGTTYTCRTGAAISVLDSNNNQVASGTTSTSSPYDVKLTVPAGAPYTVKATGGSGRTGQANPTPVPVPNPVVTPVVIPLNGSASFPNTSVSC